MTVLLSRVRTMIGAKIGNRIKAALGDQASIEQAILQSLAEAASQGRDVRLRDLHLLIDQPQPTTLRMAAQMHDERLIEVETMIVDPLAGLVSLK